MKKILLSIILLSIIKLTAQNIHPFPNGAINTYYTNITEVPDTNVIDRITYLLDDFLPTEENKADPPKYFGDMSVYYSLRIISHIQLYEYYNDIGNTIESEMHKNYISQYLIKLLGEQCANGNYLYQKPSNLCSGVLGGFPSPSNTGNDPNPRTSGEALRALISAQFFYDNTNFSSPVSGLELNDRIIQAKNALYSYPEFGDHYTNLDAFGFIGSALFNDYYDDNESKLFLKTKGAVLLNGTSPLKKDIDAHGKLGSKWDEGYQVDGSWKVNGWHPYNEPYPCSPNPDVICNTTNDPCLNWHDSEITYHSVMIEGLAELFRSLEDGALKDNAKEKLIGSINHLIDYNGQNDPIESPFNPAVTFNGVYENSRLSGDGRVSNHHREAYKEADTICSYTTIRAQGYALISSLIHARKNLDFNAGNPQDEIIEQLIDGLASLILGGTTYQKNQAVPQLYALSLYLNRDNFYNSVNLKNENNDELVISFDNEVINRYEEVANVISNYETFYTGTELTEKMVSGDFNGDGQDETLIAFEQNNISRYHENTNGNFVIKNTSPFHSGPQKVQEMAVGDFNGKGKDQAIIAFEQGNIYRFHEDQNGDFDEVASPFYQGPAPKAQKMVVGDFNGDGKDELLVAFEKTSNIPPFDKPYIYRFHENQSGDFVKESNTPIYSGNINTKEMAVGDFNGDGKDEAIITFEGGNTYRYHENENSIFLIKEGFHYGTNVRNITVGDYNDDCKDEALISFEGGDIYRFHENLSGSFVKANTNPFYSGQITSKMVSGDFNSNGIDEAIIAFNGGNIYRFHENPNGIFLIKERFHFKTPKINNISVRRRRNSETSNSSLLAQSTLNHGLLEKELSVFNIYNNGDNILIESSKVTKSEVLTYDIYGRQIFHKEFYGKTSISKLELPKGIIIIKLLNQSKQRTIKIIN